MPQRRSRVLRRDQPTTTELMTKTLLPLAGLENVLRYEPDTGDLYWIANVGYKAKTGAKAGTVSQNGYLRITYKGKHYNSHRVAWYLHTGEDPRNSIFVDHIDGNKLNNKFSNLRLATHAENRCNSKIRCTSKCGYKGVYWQHDRKKWRAQITKNRKVTNLGSFDDPYEAHLAYCAAAARLHGEFANFG